jgi:hypothetical protein
MCSVCPNEKNKSNKFNSLLFVDVGNKNLYVPFKDISIHGTIIKIPFSSVNNNRVFLMLKNEVKPSSYDTNLGYKYGKVKTPGYKINLKRKKHLVPLNSFVNSFKLSKTINNIYIYHNTKKGVPIARQYIMKSISIKNEELILELTTSFGNKKGKNIGKGILIIDSSPTLPLCFDTNFGSCNSQNGLVCLPTDTSAGCGACGPENYLPCITAAAKALGYSGIAESDWQCDPGTIGFNNTLPLGCSVSTWPGIKVPPPCQKCTNCSDGNGNSSSCGCYNNQTGQCNGSTDAAGNPIVQTPCGGPGQPACPT